MVGNDPMGCATKKVWPLFLVHWQLLGQAHEPQTAMNIHALLLLKLRQFRHILISSCGSAAKICLSAEPESKCRTALLPRGLSSWIYYRCEPLCCENCIKEMPGMHLRRVHLAILVYLGIQFYCTPFGKAGHAIENKHTQTKNLLEKEDLWTVLVNITTLSILKISFLLNAVNGMKSVLLQLCQNGTGFILAKKNIESCIY